jgi:hypothetical protein
VPFERLFGQLDALEGGQLRLDAGQCFPTFG